jgi:H+/gluconate symporter-like permease
MAQVRFLCDEMLKGLGRWLRAAGYVTAIATGGLDALPHNGAVITLLSICGLTHRPACLDIAVVAVVAPILSLVLLIALGSLVGTF